MGLLSAERDRASGACVLGGAQGERYRGSEQGSERLGARIISYLTLIHIGTRTGLSSQKPRFLCRLDERREGLAKEYRFRFLLAVFPARCWTRPQNPADHKAWRRVQ